MTLISRALTVAVLSGAVIGLPALASSFASSAAQGASSTVGSLSDSLQGSSNSSSREDKVAAGEYRLVQVAEADQPGLLRLQLQYLGGPGGNEQHARNDEGDASAADATITLTVPRAVVEQGGLSAGLVVAARHRPYGVEFARADTREAFFLVLEDAWYRELGAHAVSL
jgi:hypothetical protein